MATHSQQSPLDPPGNTLLTNPRFFTKGRELRRVRSQEGQWGPCALAGHQEQPGKHWELLLAFHRDSQQDSMWLCLQGQARSRHKSCVILRTLPGPWAGPLNPGAELLTWGSGGELTHHLSLSCSTTSGLRTRPSPPGHHWPLCSNHRCEVTGCGGNAGCRVQNRGPRSGSRLHQGTAL